MDIEKYLPEFIRRIPIHVDYVGQKKAERIFQIILVISGIIGFLVGFATQQLSYSVYTVLGGFLLSGLITLPPWPMYRRNPLEWQKPSGAVKEEKTPGSKKKKN